METGERSAWNNVKNGKKYRQKEKRNEEVRIITREGLIKDEKTF